MLQILFAGNAGHTLITRSFARQLGLVDMHGNPTQAYSRTIRVQGVVAGAFEMIKTLNITYEIKGRPHGLLALLTTPFVVGNKMPIYPVTCCNIWCLFVPMAFQWLSDLLARHSIINTLSVKCLCHAGKRMHVVAGLTEARLGCDLLISRREIADFESDGYRLSAR